MRARATVRGRNPNPSPKPNPKPNPNQVACDLPNAVLHLQWSADSTELSAVDEAGYVRVWSIFGG